MTERDTIENGDPVMCSGCNAINDKSDRSCWNCNDPVDA